MAKHIWRKGDWAMYVGKSSAAPLFSEIVKIVKVEETLTGYICQVRTERKLKWWVADCDLQPLSTIVERQRNAIEDAQKAALEITGAMEGPSMRTFGTGATRDQDESKPDYEGFFSPLVFERFGQYMHKHRKQSDGELRASDNWQKGIPLTAYMKSLWRHLVDAWKGHRGYASNEVLEEALCAIIFNAQGYLHELLKGKRRESKKLGADAYPSKPGRSNECLNCGPYARKQPGHMMHVEYLQPRNSMWIVCGMCGEKVSFGVGEAFDVK